MVSIVTIFHWNANIRIAMLVQPSALSNLVPCPGQWPIPDTSEKGARNLIMDNYGITFLW